MTNQFSNRHAGFTLVEAMVGLVLGLIVTAGVYSVYVSTSRNYIENESYSYMLESGRYALDTMAEDLLMTDFWGKLISIDSIGTSLSSSASGCADSIGMFTMSSALLFNNYHESPAVTQFSPCTGITDNRRTGTDVLAIKRVEGRPVAQTLVDASDLDSDGNVTEIITTGASDLVNGEIYLRSNSVTGNLISNASASNLPILNQSDWKYAPRVYFVRDYFTTVGDGIPALCRMSIVGDEIGNSETNAADTPECLVGGIEDIHFQFGIDTDGDGSANRYEATPTETEMDKAITVRLFVLARSQRPVTGYINDKTYTMGDIVVPAANDSIYRHVFSTTVNLRNTANISQLN